MSKTTEKRSLPSRIGRWTAELLLVFVGVSAAFWLNNYQQQREREERHQQLLASLEPELKHGILNTRENRVEAERTLAEFKRAVKAGEMPRLRPFVFTTSYNPSDMATLLQSGGFDLLDSKTVLVVREFETVVRWGLSRMARAQKLSDELIVPNLDQDISFFYDPGTKQLRKHFEFYADALQAEVDFFHDLEAKQTQLLTQIQTDRQRR